MKILIILFFVFCFCNKIFAQSPEEMRLDAEEGQFYEVKPTGCVPVFPYLVSLKSAINGDQYFIPDITIQGSHFITSTNREGLVLNPNAGHIICTTNVKVEGQLGGKTIYDNYDPYEISDVDFRINGDIDLRADEEIRISPTNDSAVSFMAEAGCYLHAYIRPQWEEIPEQSQYFKEFVEPFQQDNTINNQYNIGPIGNRWEINPNNDAKIMGIPTFQQRRHANAVSVKQTEYSPGTCIDYGSNNGSFDMVVETNNGDNNTGVQYINNGFISSKYEIHTAEEPYGRYDALAKLQSPGLTKLTRNVNFAVWMMSGILTGLSDEIDLLETINKARHDCSNLAYDGGVSLYRTEQRNCTGMLTYITDQTCPIDQAYHLYTVELEKNEIRLLFDDYLVMRWPNNSHHRGYDYPGHMLKKPYYWILQSSLSFDNSDLPPYLTAHPDGVSDSSDINVFFGELRVKYLKVSNRMKFY